MICGARSLSSIRGFRSAEIAQGIDKLTTAYGFKQIDIYTYSIDNEISFTKYEGDLNE